jgi:hypothetical protein
MHARAPFVANGQASKAVEPREGAFNDPARAPQPAPVRGAPLGQRRLDAPLVQGVAMRLRIVAAVALHQIGFPARPADAASDGRDGLHQGQQLRDVVAIGGGQLRAERNPLRVGENMMFRPGLAAIGRVRSSFFPPRNARRDALSAMARLKSNSPRRRSSASRAACRRFQTPRRCHASSRRQHVLPDPQPISFGSICQGIPLRSTNRMPVRTARSSRGRRPGYRRRRRLGGGKSGWIFAQRASSSSVRRTGRYLRGRTVPR